MNYKKKYVGENIFLQIIKCIFTNQKKYKISINMKKILYIILIAAFGFNMSCSQTSDNKKTKITFKGETEFDFGEIEYNSDGVHDFIFKNSGRYNLIITNVTSSCGCTVPVYPRKPIEKGNTDTIRVKYDTKRKGVFSKSVKVYSNAKTSPVRLRIKGEVKPPAEDDEKQ